jgi:DNA-binding MarR family transcriptional regulator
VTTSTVALEELREAFSELSAAQRRLRGRDQARPGQLSYAQFNAIRHIAEEGETTAGSIAKAAELSPASVTAMLDGLERAALVARHRSDQDRRVVIVTLTAQGRDLLDRKHAHWREIWQERFADLSEQEVEAAKRVLHELAALLDDL